MSNSKLVDYVKISPNSNNPRNDKIRKITPHHMAGNFTVEQCGDGFSKPSREASANYSIGSDGRVGLHVDEANRAWTSSSPSNDNQAVTIEVADDGGAPNWHVSDVAVAKLIDLCTDICKRNGIEKLNFTGDASGNLTMHQYFAATNCPGPYLASLFPKIAAEVNSRLSGVSDPYYCDTHNLTLCPGMLYQFKTKGKIICANDSFLFQSEKVEGDYHFTTYKALTFTAGVGFYIGTERVCIGVIKAPTTDTPYAFRRKVGDKYTIKSEFPITTGNSLVASIIQDSMHDGSHYTTIQCAGKGQVGLYCGSTRVILLDVK